MTIQFHDDIIDAQAQAILDALDADAAAGKLLVLDGTRPAKGGALTNVLAEFTLAQPAGSIVSHELVLTLPADTLGLVAGTATWVRFTDGADAFVADGSIGSDVTINSADIEVGQTVKVLSAVFGSSNL